MTLDALNHPRRGLHVRGLHATRGSFVLDVPALDLPSGEVTAILGANGSGKSTLLYALAGLVPGATGTVVLAPTDSAPPEDDLRPLRPRDIAFAFQANLFASGSVRDNLELGLGLRGVPRVTRRDQAEEAARFVGVDHLLDRRATSLSGGEQRRVSLARAVALRARVLLLDEPFASIDAPSRARLTTDLAAVFATPDTITAVVVHDRRDAALLSSRLVVVDAGRVVAAGPTQELLAHPPDRATATLFGYVVLPAGDDLYAVLPEDLRAGAGQLNFQLAVAHAADLGTHLEVTGAVGDVALTLRLSGGAGRPRPGSRITLSAARAVRLSPGQPAVS